MPALRAVSRRRSSFFVAATLAFALASPAGAVSIAVDGGWQLFQWTGGTGAIDTPADGYQFTSATSVEIQITDSTLIGDRFEVFVNSVSQGLTSATDPGDLGVPSGAFTGPDAWADGRLSKISLVLGPGSYDIDISVTTSVASTGGGFIQVLSAVPEPRALALLAAVCGAVLLVGRSRQPSARPSAPNQ